jgi:signal peptidase I
MKTQLRDVLITLAMAALIFFGLQFTLQSSIINESSMEPSFQEGQRVLVNKVVYRLHDPERGDVIILKVPPNLSPDGTPFIKRIIGLPGESVEIRKGMVYIHKEDGSMLRLVEPYVVNQDRSSLNKEKIPENEYFVLGDNRRTSDDSRGSWTVPSEDIIGKVWISIWPPGEWGLTPHYDYKGE